MKFNELIKTVDDDKLDRMQKQIWEEIKHRRRVKAREVGARIRVGDMVRLKDIRPKYMAGALCEVTAFKQTKVEVRIISGPAFRGRTMTGITVPLNCIVPLVDDVQAGIDTILSTED